MIIFYFQVADAFTIGDTLPQGEVRKIKDQFNLSFYCKYGICVVVNSNYSDRFVDIPDPTGNIRHYIAYTCTYDEIKKNACPSTENINGKSVSLECKNNKDCLSDKCVDNHCVFNDEAPMEHCDDIYVPDFFKGGNSYMHCGKPYRDTCTYNNECSSKECLKEGICNMQTKSPNEGQCIGTSIGLGSVLIFVIVIITILCICLNCYCCKAMETRKY